MIASKILRTTFAIAAVVGGSVALAPAAHAGGPATWTISYPTGGFPDTALVAKHAQSLTGTYSGNYGSGYCPGTINGTQGKAGVVSLTATFGAPCSGTVTLSLTINYGTNSGSGTLTSNVQTPVGQILGSSAVVVSIAGGGS